MAKSTTTHVTADEMTVGGTGVIGAVVIDEQRRRRRGQTVSREAVNAKLAGHALDKKSSRWLTAVPGWLDLTRIAVATMLLRHRRSRRRPVDGQFADSCSRSLLAPGTMSAPTGREIVDVSDFAVLAGLSAACGLRWIRSDAGTYVVHDGDTTYRYRTHTGAPYVVVPASTCFARRASDMGTARPQEAGSQAGSTSC